MISCSIREKSLQNRMLQTCCELGSTHDKNAESDPDSHVLDGGMARDDSGLGGLLARVFPKILDG